MSHSLARNWHLEKTGWKSNERAGRHLSERVTRVTQELLSLLCGLFSPFSVQSALQAYALFATIRGIAYASQVCAQVILQNAAPGDNYLNYSNSNGSLFIGNVPALFTAIRPERPEEPTGSGKMLRGSIR